MGLLSRRLPLLVLVLVALVWPSRADAHGGATETDVSASDYRSELLQIEPAAPVGLRFAVIDASSRLELRNTTPIDATVLGYEGEPYLRVGPDGVFENERSPATTLNRSLTPGSPAIDADPTAPPQWRKVSSNPVARWHDHRAHWMGAQPSGERSERVLVPEWSVPIRYDSTVLTVTGRIVWVPGPAALPFIAAIFAIVGLCGAGSWSHRHASVVCRAVAGALVVCLVLDLVGRWNSTSDPIALDIGLLYVPLGIVLALVLGAVLDARQVPQGRWLLGCAGLFAALLLGVFQADWLSHSQLPTSLPTVPARLLKAGLCGFGLGLAAGTLIRELRPAPRGDEGARVAQSASSGAT